MHITAALLSATPRDAEEEDMALLCCHGTQGEVFLMTRFPDEDDIGISLSLEEEADYVEGIKVTLSPTRLLVELAADDADVLNGDDALEIAHKADASDLQELEETLRNILEGTGTLVLEK